MTLLRRESVPFAAIFQRLRIERTGEFACHVVEDVGHGVLGESLEAGVGGPAQVGRQNDIVEFQDRMILRERLFDEDIESGAGDGFLLQYFHQCRLVDNRAARRVDQVARFLHQAQAGFV